jgi:hypothetical protein
MERQFNRHHGAVPRKFEVADPVQVQYRHTDEWKAASVSKWIGARLYEVTLTDGSRRRFHVNQIRPRSTHQTADQTAAQSADHYLDFLCGFNLPVPSTKGTREEPGPVADLTADLLPGTSSQGSPRLEDNQEQIPSKVSGEPRKSKRGHIPKRKFELDPAGKKYQYP